MQLATSVFDEIDRADFAWRFSKLPLFSCCEARAGTELVGFKLGYAHTTKRYYSWLGGVVSNYRQAGIGRELMILQHQWLSEQGFSIVETCTQESNTPMMRLNTQCGFVEVGNRQKDRGREIIYQKRLPAP